MGNREVSFIYIVLLCVLFLLFFSFCYVDTVCGFTTEYLDLIDYNYNYYTVRCGTTYEYVFVYTCLLLCSALLCCCLLLLAAACCCLLLLAATVRHRVPDGKICSRGSLHLIPCVFFLFIQTRLIFNVALGSTVSFLASIFLPIIHTIHPPYYGYARSQGGR